MTDEGQLSDKALKESSPGNDIHEHKPMSLLEAMEQAHYGHVAMAAK